MGFWDFLRRKRKLEFLYRIKMPVTDEELSIIGEHYGINPTDYEEIIKIFERDIKEINSLYYRWCKVFDDIRNIESMEEEIAMTKASLRTRRKKKEENEVSDSMIEGVIRTAYGEKVEGNRDVIALEKEKKELGIKLKKWFLKLIELGNKICSRIPESEIGQHLKRTEEVVNNRLKDLPILRIEK